MANFRTYENKIPISKFDLPLNIDVKLRQEGGDRSDKPLDVGLAPGSSGVDFKALTEKLSSASTAFIVRGTVTNASAEVGAWIAGSGQKDAYSETLKLTVKAAPHANAGYDVDLLSVLPLSGRSDRLLRYKEILFAKAGKDSVLSQDPDAAVLNCGDVAKDYDKVLLLDTKTSTDWIAFYKTPTSNKRADLRFDPTTMKYKVARIRSLLKSGIPVRVWVVDNDGFSTPQIMSNADNTHFITIIGYSATKFLFLDPWPDGSVTTYDGGMYPAMDVTQLGELVFDAAKAELGIVSPSTAKGTMKYTVVAGPQ